VGARDFVLTAAVLSWVGCAGTIDDPSRFELGASGAGAEPTAAVIDAGARDAAWVAAGGGWSPTSPPPVDASTRAPWPADAGDGGAWQVDAAVRDAGSAAAPDASADAGAGCNFKALMLTKCGNATCHGGPSAGAGLDLTTDGLAQRVAGRRGSDACASYLLIDTAVPDQSALYLKVTDHACGVRMPLGGTLSSPEQQCILQWIDKL
jgi:hypothetical protein